MWSRNEAILAKKSKIWRKRGPQGCPGAAKWRPNGSKIGFQASFWTSLGTKLKRINLPHPILTQKGGPRGAQGRQNGAKMGAKSEKNTVQKKVLKKLDFSLCVTPFLSIFGVFFSAWTLENIPRTGFRPKRATSSLYGKYHCFSLKIKIRDGRPPKNVLSNLWWKCDRKQGEQQEGKKDGKGEEKLEILGSFLAENGV